MYIMNPSFSNHSLAVNSNTETLLIVPCLNGYNYQRTIFQETIRTEVRSVAMVYRILYIDYSYTMYVYVTIRNNGICISTNRIR